MMDEEDPAAEAKANAADAAGEGAGPSPEKQAAEVDTKEEEKKEEKFGYAANGKVIVDAMEKKHKKIFEDFMDRNEP